MTAYPLGQRPKPITGKGAPNYSDSKAAARAEHASIATKAIWIDHAPQIAIIAQLRQYRNEMLRRPDGPINGRRLSQFTQAGKTATMMRLIKLLAEERAAQGLPPNKYQVIHITIDMRMTLKGFYQELLARLGDDFYTSETDVDRKEDRRSIKLLESRIAQFVRRLGVELLIVDEAQRLNRRGNDASEVTQRLQTFLDRGIVPMVLVGNHASREFFQKNIELAARLGTPLELKELEKGIQSERTMFVQFCERYDEALVAQGVTATPSKLNAPAILECLLKVSSGHIGRVARLLQEAAPAAAWRGAASIELFDLSNATRQYAMANQWIDWDPFSHIEDAA